MRVNRMALVLSLWALALLGLAQGEARKAIEAQYGRWSKAYVARDVKTLLSILDAKYTLTTGSGKVISRAEYEKSLRSAKPKPDEVYKTKVIELKMVKGKANVVSEETTSESEVDPKTKKAVRTLHFHRYLDVWVRRGGKWLLFSSKTLKER